MGKISPSTIIYDWGSYKFSHKVTILDTTLRDGLQSPHPTKQPTLEEKKAYIKAAQDLGIEAIEIGFPATSSTHLKDCVEMAKFAHRRNPKTLLSCLSRTVPSDIEAVAQVAKLAKAPLTANILIGSSKIRQLVETWSLPQILTWIENSLTLAKKLGLSIEFVTEDTTRSDPSTLKKMYGTAIKCGVKRIWIADTVGVATPPSAQKISAFFKKEIIGKNKVGLDWHGHDDKGLGVACSLAAALGGADRIQATALGIGERAGNASLESTAINLVLANANHYDLTKLNHLSQVAAQIFGLPIHPGYPGSGKYVFATAAGMHASAIYKALELKQPELAGLVYCPFLPKLFKRDLDILIGPMSGRANVKWNLHQLKLKATDAQIEKILTLAKNENRYLTHEDLKRLLIPNR